MNEIENKIKESSENIVSGNFSINKWDGGEYGVYSIDGSYQTGNTQYISSMKIPVKNGDTIQCGIFYSVLEDGTGKNWTNNKPTFVSVWDEEGNFNRYDASSLSFPFQADKNCIVAYSWYIGTSPIEEFLFNKYYGMIVISENEPTIYSIGGLSLNPSILVDSYSKEESDRKYLQANSKVIISLEKSVSELATQSDVITEIDIPAMIGNQLLSGEGRMIYAGGSTTEEFIPFNSSVPLEIILSEEATEKGVEIYRLFVYSEANEDAEEIVQIIPQDKTYDASKYPNCKYFRFCVKPSFTNTGLKALGNFGLTIRTVNTVSENDRSPVSSMGVFSALKNIGTSLGDVSTINELGASSMFFEKRSKLDKLITGKTYYLSSNNGDDENDGSEPKKAFRTLNKSLSVLSSGDTLLIERGSIFRDEFSYTNVDNLRFSTYGEGDRPIIEYMSLLTEWEKVDGYENIYRCPVHVYAATAERGMTQVFVDNERICSVYDTNDMTESEAMQYLEAHPDKASWCSCGKYSDGWEEKDCYYYISISDNPSNHKIEGNRYFSSILILYSSNVDIRHIITRGSGNRDGVGIASSTGIFFEDYTVLDNMHHGIVFQDAYFFNCEIKTKNAVGYQYHYLRGDMVKDGTDIICSNCRSINPGIVGSAFSGHGGSDNTGLYQNWYIENCYVEGNGSILGDMTLVNNTKVSNLIIKDCIRINAGTIQTNKKISINGMFGNLIFYTGNNPFLGVLFTDFEIKNARIKIINKGGSNNYFWVNPNPETVEVGNLRLENVVFEISSDKPISNEFFVSVAKTDLENAEWILKNVVFASNQPAKLVRSGIGMSKCKFDNVILSNVDISDAIQKYYNMDFNTYLLSFLLRSYINNGIFCSL